jgi:ribosomal protein S27AE
MGKMKRKKKAAKNELCLRCSKHYSGECKETYVKKGECDYFRDRNEYHEVIDISYSSSYEHQAPFYSKAFCPRCHSHYVRAAYKDRLQCVNCKHIFSR